jgi:hypothetical protein
MRRDHEFRGSEEVTLETFNFQLRPAFLPVGYRIQSEWYGIISVDVDYVNNDWDMIALNYGIANNRVIGGDFEDTVQHMVLVNGREAYFYESLVDDGQNTLIWEERGYAFMLTVQNRQISIDKIVQIAESINFS